MAWKSSLLAIWMTVTMLTATAQEGRIPLDGEWLFKVDSLKAGVEEQWFRDPFDTSGWEQASIPAFWESYPGLASYDGWGWFARTFDAGEGRVPLSLHFAGVDDEAEVWVNGTKIGSHAGYSDPFALDIGPALRPGTNRVVVLVKDDGGGGGIYRPVTLIRSDRLEELLRGPYAGTQPVKSAGWVRDAVIYSVYLRSFSPEGTFAGLEKRIPRLRDLGVTVLWLLPVHPVGEKNRKGTLGSPYSVRDYEAVNPEFGTMEEFRHLVHTVHRNGMKIILDLVADHTSWDNQLITLHPEWYKKDSAGRIVSPNPGWSDVAALDYSQPGLRRWMIAMMRSWVKDAGIDGFRCDVAELVPTDFWDDARKELDRIKPVMMLSEGSLPEHHAKAFDITYSWNIYDALDPLLKGERPVALLDQILRNEELQFPAGALRMRFLTNHDKNFWDAPAVEKFGADGLKLAAVLVATMPGVPMLYMGEEVANNRRLSLFEKVAVDWTRPHEMEEVYRTLFRLRAAHKALSRGATVRIPSSDDQEVYAFLRSAGSDRILVVLNFSADARSASLLLPWEKVFPGRTSLRLREVFSDEELTVEREGASGLTLDLDPRGFRVFVVER